MKRKYWARNKLETSGTAGVLETVPPSSPPQTPPCFQLMNEKLGKRKFFVIKMKAESSGKAACAELMAVFAGEI